MSMGPNPAQAPAGRSNGKTSNAAAIAEAIAVRVAELLAEQPASEDLLDAKAAAKLLGVPESWVRSEAREFRLPHIKLGHYVRFDRDELLAWRRTMAAGPRVLRTGSRPVSERGKAA
jgi:excisionase family DNA binding protein